MLQFKRMAKQIKSKRMWTFVNNEKFTLVAAQFQKSIVAFFFQSNNPLIAARISLIWSNPSLSISYAILAWKSYNSQIIQEFKDFEYKSDRVVCWSSKLSKLGTTYTLCFATCTSRVLYSSFKLIFKSYSCRLAKHFL